MHVIVVVTHTYKKGKKRGRTFDSEGGGMGLFEINSLILKMLKINNLISSGKRVNKMTFNFTRIGENCLFKKITQSKLVAPLDSPYR